MPGVSWWPSTIRALVGHQLCVIATQCVIHCVYEKEEESNHKIWLNIQFQTQVYTIPARILTEQQKVIRIKTWSVCSRLQSVISCYRSRHAVEPWHLWVQLPVRILAEARLYEETRQKVWSLCRGHCGWHHCWHCVCQGEQCHSAEVLRDATLCYCILHLLRTSSTSDSSCLNWNSIWQIELHFQILCVSSFFSVSII